MLQHKTNMKEKIEQPQMQEQDFHGNFKDI